MERTRLLTVCPSVASWLRKALTSMLTRGIALAAVVGMFASGILVIGVGPAAIAGDEQPTVHVVGNAPGLITITYYHSGTGGVQQYELYGQGDEHNPTGILYSPILYSPEGQWFVANLQPNTAYSFKVCARYWDDPEPVCSPFVTGQTLPPPSGPPNFRPPVVTNVEATPDSVTVSWGETGDYTRILILLTDWDGGLDQREVRNVPNSSYTFHGLEPGFPYHLSLKGCTLTLFGSSCGPWSQAVMVITPKPPEALPPMPPEAPPMTDAVPAIVEWIFNGPAR